MTMYCIYEHPRDYPNKYVVREILISKGETKYIDPPTAIVDTLNDARTVIPNGLIPVPRHPTDDPVIIETWF